MGDRTTLFGVETVPISKKMLNGSAEDMNVNGSVTEQEFQFAPSGSDIYYLDSVMLYLSDSGDLDETKFGAIAGGLTDGLELALKSNGGSEQQLLLAKNNIDLTLCNHELFVSDASTGFLSTNKFIRMTYKFELKPILDATLSDYIRWTVSDNLTGLNFLRSRCFVFEETVV